MNWVVTTHQSKSTPGVYTILHPWVSAPRPCEIGDKLLSTHISITGSDSPIFKIQTAFDWSQYDLPFYNRNLKNQ